MDKLIIRILYYLKIFADKFWHLFEGSSFIKILHYEENRPFENEKPVFSDKQISESFAYQNVYYPHVEFVKCIKKRVTIEPDYLYAITGLNNILKDTVIYESLLPSFPRYLLSKVKRKHLIHDAILFDGNVGLNYFHFYSDIIGKIFLFERIEGYQSMPILIGEKVFNTPYFQFLYNSTYLKNLNWRVVKKEDYININNLYILKPKPFNKKYFRELKTMFGIKDNSTLKKKVFLTRSVSAGRYVNNMSQVEEVLFKYGFDIIDTAGMDIYEQAVLFNEIKYLVSIHGAGNTNIIFSSPGIRFLEINPANRMSCQYYWLSLALQINYYDCILGGEVESVHKYPEGGFYIDPKCLEMAIRLLISDTNDTYTHV